MTQGWIEKVAESAEVSISDAAKMLTKRGIYPDRPLRPARSLVVTRILFKGEKKGQTIGRVEFDWSGLSAGVWAVTSHENLVGKSTVLEILLWCLRGEPKGLQDDVRGWLEWVLVGFEVDDQRYIVEFTVLDKKPTGTLSRLRPDGVSDVLDQFSSDQGFSETMSRFMMVTLDLDPVPSRQGNKDYKQTIIHGWAALSGALYFGGDHKLLLGDIPWSGLPARMLQMYVGLPWATTVMQASTANKEVEQDLTHSTRTTSEAATRTAQARTRIEADLKTARQTLVDVSTENETADKLQEIAKEIPRLSAIALEIEQSVAAAETEHQLLKLVANDDERRTRDLREDLVATLFFNGLQPTCCPRCDSAVTRDRLKKESSQFSCSLCSEPIPEDQLENASDAIQDAEQRYTQSKLALGHNKTVLLRLRGDLQNAQENLKQVSSALVAATQNDSFTNRREAELAVARLEGALQELQVHPAELPIPNDALLVKAALVEADAAFKLQRGDILDRLNEEILRLAVSFGVLRLEKVQLNWVAQMRLEKGGESTSFSKLTTGERLRLRIATAIALLRVGYERGVGRHPGLLIIDSPGAEETSGSNLAALLSELKQVAQETPGLQILIASADAPAVVPSLGKDRCRIAARGTYLW
ncbi:hypothetical protein [Denitrificimonas caeni]|uniref:hypothetical protein n=1 Tax=Denitrificimonas caeni TaxID=521720 RepID=UPI001965C3DB|nr:hypothetical protein [Denitrificimonas caeni]